MALQHPDLSEVVWRKSRRSSSQGQNCVEVTTNSPGIVAIRDSKAPGGAMLLVSAYQWQAFISSLRDQALR